MTKLIAYAKLMRLHRPVGIWLLLWPTLWALWIAGQGHPSPRIVVIFIAGVVLMRSAGCVINDIADRKFDAHVKRTKDRPLATGSVTVREAFVVFGILCLAAFLLVLQLNGLTIGLSLVGLGLAIVYPFMKRYTHWPQVVLGAAYGFAVPMAFAAQQNAIPPIAWLLYAVALLWPLAYDTLYAMVDRKDDKRIGVKSTAVLLGHYDILFVGIIQGCVLVLLMIIGWLQQFHAGYYLALLIGSGLFLYQHYLIRSRDPEQCFRAFSNNPWFGFVMFLGIYAAA